MTDWMKLPGTYPDEEETLRWTPYIMELRHQLDDLAQACEYDGDRITDLQNEVWGVGKPIGQSLSNRISELEREGKPVLKSEWEVQQAELAALRELEKAVCGVLDWRKAAQYDMGIIVTGRIGPVVNALDALDKLRAQ